MLTDEQISSLQEIIRRCNSQLDNMECNTIKFFGLSNVSRGDVEGVLLQAERALSVSSAFVRAKCAMLAFFD